MGNTQSNDGNSAASPSSQSGREHGHGQQRRSSTPRVQRSGSQRQKLRARPNNSSPLPAETSEQHVEATISASPHRAHAHTRAQSITNSIPIPVAAAEESLAHSQRSHLSAMGQADSKPSSTALPIHHSSPPRKSIPSLPQQEESTESTESAESQPVAVPPPNHNVVNDVQDDYIPTGYSESPYGLPPANYSRPPRLPLPIEEEEYRPGSPIITPQDISAIKDDDIEGGAIPRIASVRSATTVDDDDVGDNDAFDTSGLNHLQVKIPIKLAWNGGGDKIFVTGTFCNWEKKIKLPRNRNGSPGFSANVHLPPGTHHVKFLVDGDMVTSPDLPTTVDWTNILVNYIEVVAPLPEETQTQPAEPAKPMPIPGAAITAGQATSTDDGAAKPTVEQTQSSETAADLPATLHATDGSTEHPATGPVSISETPTPRQTAPQPVPETKSKPTPAPPKQKVPRHKYTNKIPQFLVDLDNYNNPEDERYQRAQRVTTTLPQPPSLPMFLNKSILNGATPHKDDASVLIMPNHTVLNHLATSSIRSGVLATSGTTRYKRKVCCSIPSLVI